MSNDKKKTSLCNTDALVRLVYNSLREDLHSVVPCIEHRSPVLTADVKAFREYVWPDLFGTVRNPSEEFKAVIVQRFKASYQIESLLRKYRFQNDSLTTKQLKEVTYQKYVDFQASRSCYREVAHRYPVYASRSFRVLQRARKLIKKILGEFSWDEVFENCRFGGNSSVGCTFADAYLDYKLSEPEAFTGTVESVKKFSEYLQQDSLLSRYLKGRVPLTHKVLPLIQVPKKYNINRTITPLTLLGLWLSYGLGRVIEDRLRRHGLNIKRLQVDHAKWIEEYSNDLTHGTLDMSFGSENITSGHLNSSLPRPWFNALKMTFSHQLSHDGVQLYTESVMPMGNGATFPVETLFFYGLIRATGYLARVPGRYSVYGDDIILPTKAVKYVIPIFEDLKLRLNIDKSFVTPHFRESCGADFYYGVSVRPFFMPEGIKYSRVTSSRYILWLHKCINGLTRRWAPAQVRKTLQILLNELHLACNGKIFCIPPSFPDVSGVKIEKPYAPLTCDPYNWQLPTVDYLRGSRNYSFCYFLELPSKRGVVSTTPYYWDTLRAKAQPLDEDTSVSNFSNISYVDHLRSFDEARPVLHEDLKYIRFKMRDKLGNVRMSWRVKWVYSVADRNNFTISIRAREALRPPGRRGQDPIISDWI